MEMRTPISAMGLLLGLGGGAGLLGLAAHLGAVELRQAQSHIRCSRNVARFPARDEGLRDAQLSRDLGLRLLLAQVFDVALDLTHAVIMHICMMSASHLCMITMDNPLHDTR